MNKIQEAKGKNLFHQFKESMEVGSNQSLKQTVTKRYLRGEIKMLSIR